MIFFLFFVSKSGMLLLMLKMYIMGTLEFVVRIPVSFPNKNTFFNTTLFEKACNY